MELEGVPGGRVEGLHNPLIGEEIRDLHYLPAQEWLRHPRHRVKRLLYWHAETRVGHRRELQVHAMANLEPEGMLGRLIGEDEPAGCAGERDSAIEHQRQHGVEVEAGVDCSTDLA